MAVATIPAGSLQTHTHPHTHTRSSDQRVHAQTQTRNDHAENNVYANLFRVTASCDMVGRALVVGCCCRRSLFCFRSPVPCGSARLSRLCAKEFNIAPIQTRNKHEPRLCQNPWDYRSGPWLWLRFLPDPYKHTRTHTHTHEVPTSECMHRHKHETITPKTMYMRTSSVSPLAVIWSVAPLLLAAAAAAAFSAFDRLSLVGRLIFRTWAGATRIQNR